jgi:hypothetical protein
MIALLLIAFKNEFYLSELHPLCVLRVWNRIGHLHDLARVSRHCGRKNKLQIIRIFSEKRPKSASRSASKPPR